MRGAGRIAGIDLARGLAVIGMLAAHLYALPALDLLRPATWGGIADGRSSILFALLAGVSIALVTGGRTPVRGDARSVAARRLVVRAIVLWVIGILLVLTGVPVYVILPAYAILFLLAVPLIGASGPVLLALAAVLGLVMPWVLPLLNALPVWTRPGANELFLGLGWAYPFPVWVAFIVAGMAIGRSDLRAASTAVVLLSVGLALAAVAGIVGTLLATRPLDPYLAQVLSTEPHGSGVLEVIGSGGVAAAVLGACLLVCRIPLLASVLLPLRAVGSMPLTAYVGQIVAWAVVAALTIGQVSDLEGFRALHPFWPFVIGTLVFATAWALLRGRGPLESLVAWLVRWAVPSSPADAPSRLER